MIEIIEIKNPDEMTLCSWGDSLSSSKKPCFKQAKWYIEGSFYCTKHKEKIIKMMEGGEKQCITHGG